MGKRVDPGANRKCRRAEINYSDFNRIFAIARIIHFNELLVSWSPGDASLHSPELSEPIAIFTRSAARSVSCEANAHLYFNVLRIRVSAIKRRKRRCTFVAACNLFRTPKSEDNRVLSSPPRTDTAQSYKMQIELGTGRRWQGTVLIIYTCISKRQRFCTDFAQQKRDDTRERRSVLRFLCAEAHFDAAARARRTEPALFDRGENYLSLLMLTSISFAAKSINEIE